jgi:DNA-binding transcriptional ArsR family regulator
MTTFEALVEPKRRSILDLLAQGEAPVGDLVRKLGMSQPAVSKHLRVLRDAGLVTSKIDAQRRIYAIDPRPLKELDAWVAKYRPFWTNKLDALESALNERKR